MAIFLMSALDQELFGCYVCDTNFLTVYFSFLQLSEPMEGLKEWLTAVSTARIPCAVVSGLDRTDLVDVLIRMGLYKYFQVFEFQFLLQTHYWSMQLTLKNIQIYYAHQCTHMQFYIHHRKCMNRLLYFYVKILPTVVLVLI